MSHFFSAAAVWLQQSNPPHNLLFRYYLIYSQMVRRKKNKTLSNRSMLCNKAWLTTTVRSTERCVRFTLQAATDASKEATSPKRLLLFSHYQKAWRRRTRRRRKVERRADKGEVLNKSCLFAVAVSLRGKQHKGQQVVSHMRKSNKYLLDRTRIAFVCKQFGLFNSLTWSEIHFPSLQKTCSDFLLLSPFFSSWAIRLASWGKLKRDGGEDGVRGGRDSTHKKDFFFEGWSLLTKAWYKWNKK